MIFTSRTTHHGWLHLLSSVTLSVCTLTTSGMLRRWEQMKKRGMLGHMVQWITSARERRHAS